MTANPYPLRFGPFEAMVFPFAKVGYVSFLEFIEGNKIMFSLIFFSQDLPSILQFSDSAQSVVESVAGKQPFWSRLWGGQGFLIDFCL